MGYDVLSFKFLDEEQSGASLSNATMDLMADLKITDKFPRVNVEDASNGTTTLENMEYSFKQ